MLTRLFLIVSLFSLCFYLYGILYTILNVEPNSCTMTYMFKYPQFVRIHFKENDDFPKYGLYAYSEGGLTEKARAKEFTGAPVIFVPGNSGSHKQARSLASIALQKGLDNGWRQHLDYFTIDYNEEYSALFGGYLENQKTFLKHSIKTVLNLYKKLEHRPTQVVLVGHSMGGKISEALLADPEYTPYINTIISIAGPVDQPVINIDPYIEAFYRNTENALSNSMRINEITNTTNYCGKQISTYVNSNKEKTKLPLDDILFITIGGGSRDYLVQSGLTSSKYSDIHALTTSIPLVWLPVDHLCAVWCKELMLVINRFLYDIISYQRHKNAYRSGQSFVKEKDIKLSKASYHFVKPTRNQQRNEINMISNEHSLGDWVEDSRRVFNVAFKDGLKETRYQMIRLLDIPQHQILTVEAVNIESHDWVYGCAAIEVVGSMRVCSKATSLTHLANHLPSAKHERYFLSVDLHKLKRANPNWTHVLLRIAPTRKPIWLNVDIHSPGDRLLQIQMPKWYSYSKVLLKNDTMLGSSFFRLALTGLEEAHQALEIELKPRRCTSDEDHAVAEVCVPWTRGCERFQYITYKQHKSIMVSSTIPKPLKYNTSENPIYINLHLDPSCRYSVSMKNSFGGTLSRIFLQFSHWLPAHLTAILFLALRYQISISPQGSAFKCGKLHSALLSCSPFFIITATRIFAKFIQSARVLPEPDDFHQSMLVSIIIHGTALALLTLLTGGVWLGITICGSVLHKLIFKTVQLPIPPISSAVVPIIQKIPVSAVVVLISMMFAACGGLGLICACVVHFILMTKRYEDYLEEFVFKTARMIAEKLFGKKSHNNPASDANNETQPSDEKVVSEQTEKNQVKSKEDSENDEKEKDDIGLEAESNTDQNSKQEPEESESQPQQENQSQLAEQNTLSSADIQKLGLSKTDEDMLNRIDQLNDEELDKLLKETIDKQREMNRQRLEADAAKRKEYDSIHEGLSGINFHMTLFLLLILLAIMNFPATLSWAKNYHYSRKLVPDPSLIPGTIVLAALAIIWQFNTPRNICAYRFVSVILYILAAICIIYCQDSVYRLNAVISTAFVFIALHQIFAPKIKEANSEDDGDDELRDRIEKMKATLTDSIIAEEG